MSSRKNDKRRTLYNLAQAYISGELSMPELPDLTPEVREIIVRLVPEAEEIILEQERSWGERGLPITTYEYVGYLAQVLLSSLEEGNRDLTERCLRAAEELLGNPSDNVRDPMDSAYLCECVDFQIIESLGYLLREVRELCGPRVLVLLEREIQ
ncbi:hypothetical protein ACFY19_23565 [Streptosporangium saharense]|uniref:hypothetical protein n=1 Tax=Streptosporangium saharense TaxID=1706840 RepID=UPI003689711D